MAGNALSRNPAMPTVAYDRLTTSTLEGQLSFASEFAGADIKDERPQFTYPNPETGQGKKDERFLTGSAAYKAAISSSVLGTGYAPGFFQQKASSYGASMSTNQETPDGVDGEYYTVDPDALSLGPAKNSRPAALISDLTEEEKKIYTDCIALINQNISSTNAVASSTGFQISALAKDKAILLKYRDVGGEINDQGTERKAGQDFYRNLPESFIDLPDPSYFFPSLALMKMLIELTGTEGLTIGGRFAFERGSNLTSGDADMSEEDGKKIISDHSFGRAFDIHSLGQKNVTNSSKAINSSTYKDIFTTLMQKIATLPPYLQPDSVVISRGMFSQYLAPGSENSARKATFGAAFPGLAKHVRVGHDAEGSQAHDTHIHIGFHWTRAGNPAYFLNQTLTGPESNPIGIDIVSPTSFESTQDINYYISLGTKSYAQEPNEKSVAVDKDGKTSFLTFGKLLATTGIFNLEEIAMFCGLAYRESNVRPRSTDGKAFGIFQNEVGVGTRYQDRLFHIPYGESSRFTDGKRTLRGWQIAFKKEIAETLEEAKGKEMTRDTVDPVFYYPINQIAVAAQVARIYVPAKSDKIFSQSYKQAGLRKSSQSKPLWSNWGDSDWGDGILNLKYGMLSAVPVKIVYDVYTGLGGEWKTFVNWALGKRTATNGALVDCPKVSILENIFARPKEEERQYYPYRSYWDVFVWVFNLYDRFEEIDNEFTFTQSTAYGKGFTRKRNQIFNQQKVENAIAMSYTEWLNDPGAASGFSVYTI